MAKAGNIVHQYFKKTAGTVTLLVKVNPIQLKATEITLEHGQDPVMREVEIDAAIFDDLQADGFVAANPLEFNLYLSGLLK